MGRPEHPDRAAPAHDLRDRLATRADPAGRRLWLAIGEVFDDAAPGFAGRGGARGRWIGRALHAAYQEGASLEDPGFRAEVPLRWELDHAGWQVHLHGRADGVRRTPDGGWRVEELKTRPPGGPGALGRGARAAPRGQVALYAWIWSLRPPEPVHAALVWLPLDGAEPEHEAVSVDPARLERELRECLDRRLAALAEVHAVQAARRKQATRVRFPHAVPRPGQAEIGRAVEHALEAREHLLVEAPTGLGKTAAVLTPVVRAALERGLRVAVLAPTGLAQRAAARTLRALAPSRDLPLAVRVRARARMCANDALVCHETLCAFARDYREKVASSGALATLFEDRPVVGPGRVGALGRAVAACPFELSIDAARAVPVTVCDYNYVFDRAPRPPGADAVAPEDVVLVVDEVHRLEERARALRGATLDGSRVARAAEAAAVRGTPLHRAQEELCRALQSLLEETACDALGGATPADGAPSEFELPHEAPGERLEALATGFDRVLLQTLAWRDGDPTPPDDPFLEIAFALDRWRLSGEGPGTSATLVGRHAGTPRLRRVCLDAARELAPRLAACHAFIGLSATPGDPIALRDRLGLDPARFALERAPDPFPAEHRRLVIDPGLDTRHASRSRAVRPVATRLAALAEAVPGHCLALLPSHAFLAAVREALPTVARRVLCQQRGDDDAAREALLEALEAPEPALLLAVAGGVFAESVEPGASRLSAVAVVGPCLPAADAERRLLEVHYEERFGRGFELAYVEPGMTRVVQAAGRLLRSPDDAGVVALLGRRFLREPYRSWIPERWLAGRPPEDHVGDAARAAADFFARRA